MPFFDKKSMDLNLDRIDLNRPTLLCCYKMMRSLMPGFHHSVAVLPLPFSRSRYPLPFAYTAAVAAAVCLGSSASMIG